MNDLVQSYLAQFQPDQLERLKRYYQIAISDTMRRVVTADSVKDPILAQFLPQVDELTISESERFDPIGDRAYMPVLGLVHRYPNRVLWTVTPTCAVYCRFCFRKEMIGRKGQAMRSEERDHALTYIRTHCEIEEVIFSGGDPLTLTNSALSRLIKAIEEIKHVKRIRIHTRIPIVQPDRIDDDFCQILANSSKASYLVIHANHPQEFTDESKRVLRALRAANVLLFSQTVLLKGINDDVEILVALMNTFLQNGITPYYLHHLDLAKGTQHFRVSLDEGLALESALRKRLSGIAIPTYIVEIPGGEGKVPVNALNEAQISRLQQLGIH